MTTKTIADMEARRRKLDREIRSAKRAEAKRQREALLSARQALGVWLSESVGADTLEAVGLLREALSTGQVQQLLEDAMTAKSPNTFDTSSTPHGVPGVSGYSVPQHDASRRPVHGGEVM